MGGKPAIACSGDPMLGSVCLVGFNFCPRNFLPAEGQLISISSNTALFALLGTTYGGDGRTTFALPDLRGRAPIHFGAGPGLSNYPMGQRGGFEAVNLTALQMPAHNHTASVDLSAVTATLNAASTGGDTAVPTGNVLADSRRSAIYSTGAADQSLDASAVSIGGIAAATTANAGNGASHENRPPYLAMRYCVAVQGIFPSRN